MKKTILTSVKSIKSFLLLIAVTLSCALNLISQDFKDPFDVDGLTGYQFPEEEYNIGLGGDEYAGEYELFGHRLFWSISDGAFDSFPSLNRRAKSIKIEVVSFPFMPDCWGGNCFTGSNPRILIAFDPSEASEVLYSVPNSLEVAGIGWTSGDNIIFMETEIHPWGAFNSPTIPLTSSHSLSSIAYVLNSQGSKILPHSILKFTVYIHSDTPHDSDILDSLSWLVDNTRGRMKYYPFSDANAPNGEKQKYDLRLYPRIHNYEEGVNYWHTYDTEENINWYVSPSINNNGSVDYFPFEEVGQNSYIEGVHPGVSSVYFDPEHVEFTHPPGYSLIYCPVRNSHGKAYAGFDDTGYFEAGGEVEEGKEHIYKIDFPINLEFINPHGKIIYKPSYCNVETTLTFPGNYKFLSVHGKPADRELVDYYKNVYWPERGWNFEFEKEVPVPYPEGIPWSVYYIDEGSAIIIEPNVIVMNAEFIGPETNNKGLLRYYPDQTYGNFTLSENLKLGILTDKYYITENTTWERIYELHGSCVYIEPGATLVIKEKVYVSPATKIVVKRGGKLVIDGATITGFDDDIIGNEDTKMWPGIEVWGTASEPPSNYNAHGHVVLKNSAVIENAKYAIRTIKADSDQTEGEQLDYHYTGGQVVIESNSIIRNCENGICFYPYDYDHISVIKDAAFETTADLFNSSGLPQAHIYLNNVFGVDIKGCTFTNSRDFSEIGLAERGTGISSFNSGFNVVPFCTEEISPCPLENQQPNVFDKLYYGIKAMSGSASQMVVVESNEFEACSRNIYLSGVDDALVTGNDFTGMQFGGYGLYLDASTSFHVEANNFTDSPDAFGIIVNNSGGEPNMVYLNYFDGLKFAINAQNENRAVDGTGLLLKCNEYIDNTFDQVVTWEGTFMNKKAGIAEFQGANAAAPDAPAGNLFSWSGTTAFSDFYNEANSIIYYYHVNPLYHLQPQFYSEETVFPEAVLNAPWNEYSCPPSDQGGGGGTGDTEEMKSLITLSGQKADSVNAIIEVLKDGGSTEALKWEVDMSTPPETYTVYNELMNNSPFISDTVMESAIEKEEVLPNVMIRDVMVANPHNTKDESLLEKIGERSDPMPEYMIAQILQGQSLVSAFENLQSQKAFYKQQRSLATNALIKLYLSDTLDPIGSKDSLKVLLENENSKGAKYRLAFLSMEQGAWSEGQQVLNEIPQQFNLTEDELATHQQYSAFYNLLSGLLQQGKTVSEMDSAQIELLLNIEVMQAGKPSVYARNMLLALEQVDYEEPILLPDLFKSTAVQEERQRIMQSLDEHRYLSLFPNPAGDYLVIEHNLEMEYQKVLVKINNIKGECVKQIYLTDRQNQQTVDIRSLKTGIYTATIVANQKELETVKFTKK